jgi:hypothetical protein
MAEVSNEFDLAALIDSTELLAEEDAPAFLRAELRRRVDALAAYMPERTAPAAAEADLADSDIERIIYLVGTAREALKMIAAAIAELSITPRAIEDLIRWMDIRPVALNPGQGYLGIDITYILSFRALTRSQRWLLHNIAWWAPPPATISSQHALSVAEASGNLFGLTILPGDIDRLSALGFITPVTWDTTPDPSVVLSSVITNRLSIDPYVRYIAQGGLNSWPQPENLPEDSGPVSAVQVVAYMLVDWATSFANVIAGPRIMPEDPDADDTEEDDEPANLTPEPELDALTSDEFWAALLPEIPHMARAISLIRELGADEHLYILCKLLITPLRQRAEPEAQRLRRALLEAGLLTAREKAATRETMLLATQLADLEIDENKYDRAEGFANEALTAAIAIKDMRAIGFVTRRLGAIVLHTGKYERAREIARQAVALAQANGNESDLAESIALLDAASQFSQE